MNNAITGVASPNCKTALLVAYLMLHGIPDGETCESYYAKIWALPLDAVPRLSATESWKAYRSIWVVQECGGVEKLGGQYNVERCIRDVCGWDDATASAAIREMVERGYISMGRRGGSA